MRALLIGGTRFLGHFTAERLLKEGARVTLLHRGRTPSAFEGSVEEILADRTDPGAWSALPKGASWDMAVDFCAYAANDTVAATRALEGRVGRFAHVSTGQVYLVLNPVPSPAREEDYAGDTMPPPAAGRDHDEWAYGMGKRGCEDALAEAATRGFPATTLRLPVVQGPRDPKMRLEPYVRAILDGRPLPLRETDRTRALRYLFVRDFGGCIAGLLRSKAGLGRAYNLSMDDDGVTLPDFLRELAHALGREAELRLEPAPASPPRPWASFLDPSRAERELAFRPTPWREWLAETARWYAA